MRCRPLSSLLQQANMEHIDYLSLDVEGSELDVLSSIDWARTTITLMTVEDTTARIHAFLRTQQMLPVLCLFGDTLFVRSADQSAVREWLTRIGSLFTVREGKGMRLLSARVADCMVPVREARRRRVRV